MKRGSDEDTTQLPKVGRHVRLQNGLTERWVTPKFYLLKPSNHPKNEEQACVQLNSINNNLFLPCIEIYISALVTYHAGAQRRQECVDGSVLPT
jgi:hypothetical protein